MKKIYLNKLAVIPFLFIMEKSYSMSNQERYDSYMEWEDRAMDIHVAYSHDSYSSSDSCDYSTTDTSSNTDSTSSDSTPYESDSNNSTN